ncbi:MAG: hypothetical protein LLG01_08990 [Planctomycetaceae bacterium]|nr:hypothetical protein [Planctomycetaceae bacterium]
MPAMARNRGFIPGIFNYCDRWCERCAFAERCMVAADEAKGQQRQRRKGRNPDDGASVAEEVSRNFRKVGRLIARGAKKWGLDMKEIEREAATLASKDFAKLDDHPLVKEAFAYMTSLRKFVESLAEDFKMTAEDVMGRAAFMEVENDAAKMKEIRFATEALVWDSSMVAVKTKRALDSFFDSDEAFDQHDEKSHIRDAEMTAAIVLRCLNRDKAALVTIYEWNKDRQDAALELLVHADRIGRALRTLLPGCVHQSFPPKILEEQ